jgi:hypothetical protein
VDDLNAEGTAEEDLNVDDLNAGEALRITSSMTKQC